MVENKQIIGSHSSSVVLVNAATALPFTIYNVPISSAVDITTYVGIFVMLALFALVAMSTLRIVRLNGKIGSTKESVKKPTTNSKWKQSELELARLCIENLLTRSNRRIRN